MLELNGPLSEIVDEETLPVPVGPTIEVAFESGKGAGVVNAPSADVLKPPDTMGEYGGGVYEVTPPDAVELGKVPVLLANELELLVGKGGVVESVEEKIPPEMLVSEIPVVRGPTVLFERAGSVTVI